MQSLQPVLKAAIRVATGAYKTSTVLSLHADSGIISLQNSIENKIIYYLLRLRSTKDTFDKSETMHSADSVGDNSSALSVDKICQKVLTILIEAANNSLQIHFHAHSV